MNKDIGTPLLIIAFLILFAYHYINTPDAEMLTYGRATVLAGAFVEAIGNLVIFIPLLIWDFIKKKKRKKELLSRDSETHSSER